jgi:hypothetical protein
MVFIGFSGEPNPKSFTGHHPLATFESASKPATEMLQLYFSAEQRCIDGLPYCLHAAVQLKT